MRMIAGAAALAAIVAASAGAQEPAKLTAGQVNQMKAAVRAAMRDPDSARFGPLAAGRDKDGLLWVCGWVNGRNAFGGYVGMRPYLGAIEGRKVEVGKIASDDFEARWIANFCARNGAGLPRM